MRSWQGCRRNATPPPSEAADPTTFNRTDRSLCLRNSCRKMPRSGFLVLGDPVGLELGRWQAAWRRVQPFPVINLLQEFTNGGASLGQIAILLPIHLFVFERFHERFVSRIVVRISFAAHADGDVLVLQQSRLIRRCVEYALAEFQRELAQALSTIQDDLGRLRHRKEQLHKRTCKPDRRNCLHRPHSKHRGSNWGA